MTTPFDPLVPIGRFSDMTRLSIKALRHYDEVGLLPPAAVDPVTGYRSYEPAQANRAEAIRLLRSVDMPLDEIRELLELDDTDARVAMLRAYRDRLEARLAEHQRRLGFLERLIDRGAAVHYEVAEVELEPQPVLAVGVHTDLDSVGRAVADGFGLLGAHVGRHGIELAGPPLIVFDDIIDTDQDGEIVMCFPVAGPAPTSDRIVHRTLAGGPAISTLHHGRYHEIAPAYHTLVGWMHEHGCEPAQPPREVYLNDPGEVAEDDQLTQIVWPVHRVGDGG